MAQQQHQQLQGKRKRAEGKKLSGMFHLPCGLLLCNFISSGWDNAVLDGCFQGTASSR
jgi:hypothetical protein